MKRSSKAAYPAGRVITLEGQLPLSADWHIPAQELLHPRSRAYEEKQRKMQERKEKIYKEWAENANNHGFRPRELPDAPATMPITDSRLLPNAETTDIEGDKKPEKPYRKDYTTAKKHRQKRQIEIYSEWLEGRNNHGFKPRIALKPPEPGAG